MSGSDARDFCESKFTEIVDKCLEDFPNIEALRFEQKMCLFNLRGGGGGRRFYDASRRLREHHNVQVIFSLFLPFFARLLFAARPLFRSSPLTESLAQAKVRGV